MAELAERRILAASVERRERVVIGVGVRLRDEAEKARDGGQC